MILKESNMPNQKLIKKGKVRDIYNLSQNLLIISSDRISAFDYILPQGIPDKGKVLTNISMFWFDYLSDVIPNHLITANAKEYTESLLEYIDQLEGRSMIVQKTEVIKIECIVRGYITGSGWKDYQKTGQICGITLPENLKKSQKLKEPIFTPSTKPDIGHDENIDEKEAINIAGQDIYNFIKEKSLELYTKAHDYAYTKGIIIADTKFEFGAKDDGEIILIDEVLTPDSSRFWPKDQYQLGQDQPSFDKQFVRDYLTSISWDKNPPAPDLPKQIIEKTREKYLEAYKKITDKSLL